MRVNSPDFLQEAAYHEAGHAVAAIRLGLRLLGMSLVPDDNYDAAVLLEESLDAKMDPERSALVEKKIIVALAGPVAASRFKEEPLSKAAGSGEDFIKALSLVLETGMTREDFGRLVKETFELIHDPMTWNAVQELVGEAICRFLWAGWVPSKKENSQQDLFEGLRGNQGELFDSPAFEPRMRGEEIERVIARADEAFKRRREEVKAALAEKHRRCRFALFRGIPGRES